MTTYTATIQADEVQSTIRAFILNNFVLPDGSTELNDNDSLSKRGIIDSTGVLETVMFIEETFGISVEDDDIIPDNMDSVNKVTAYILRKA